MNNYPEVVREPQQKNKFPVSELVKAYQDLGELIDKEYAPPEGLFGRLAIIETNGMKFRSDELDIEFDVPFDDDIESNEAEVVIYNLSDKTIAAIKDNKKIVISAGYKGVKIAGKPDIGIIFEGYISKVKSKWSGVDRITTIYAVDAENRKERDIANKAYTQGTKASYILRDLINETGLAVQVFKTTRDYACSDDVTVSGGLMNAIRKWADECGTTAYINKNKVYVRPLTDGDNIRFTVSDETGLISSPSEFTEEMSYDDGTTKTITGYEFSILGQHRITTAAIIELKSRNVSGKFRVRSGSHRFSPDEFVTEVEVIE